MEGLYDICMCVFSLAGEGIPTTALHGEFRAMRVGRGIGRLETGRRARGRGRRAVLVHAGRERDHSSRGRERGLSFFA